MKAQKYRITCLNCKGSSKIQIINDKDVIYVDHVPIIACRLRGDLQWGFECQCGNDSRLAKEELSQIDNLVVKGSREAIQKIADSLKVKDKLKFNMENI